MPASDRRAETSRPILGVLADRWSARAFHSDHELDDDALQALLEAARWAPSAMNRQPRRFIVGRRGGRVFASLVDTLRGRNLMWAPRASALILGIAVRSVEEPESAEYAVYDLGQAVAHLSVQAVALGLNVRQIGGFDKDKAARLFDLAAEHEPFVIVAVGRRDEISTLDEGTAARERAPRRRLAIAEIVLDHD